MLLKLVCVAGGRRGRVKTKQVSAGNSAAPPKKNEALPLTQYCKRILPIFKSCRAEEAVGWRTRVQYYSRRSRVMSHPILFFQTESNFQGRSHAYEREAADITFLSELKIPKRKKGAINLFLSTSLFFYHFIRKQATCFAFAFC